MADLIAKESAIFKELITLINTELIDKYKGTVTEQTLGTMVIGLTTAALDKAFQKPLFDKDLELKEAQKLLFNKDLELKEAQKALINSQKAQYDSYLIRRTPMGIETTTLSDTDRRIPKFEEPQWGLKQDKEVCQCRMGKNSKNPNGD